MIRPRSLLAPNPGLMTLDGTRTYIVGVDRPVVIDPGPAISEHLARILDTLGGSTPVALLLTHAHADHSGCAVELAVRTGAPLRMAAGALEPGELADHGEPLEPGESVRTDAGSLLCLPTPGHTPEHMAFVWTGPEGTEAGAFVGDLLLGEGDTTLVATPEGDVRSYLASLDRVDALDVPVLYPTHGPPITRPREALRHFREHRLERARQIAALRQTNPDASADDFVVLLYGNALPAGLRQAAAASVEATLRYLASS